MLVPDITIYDALKGMLGEEKARQVVQGIKDQVVQEVEIQKNVLATKEDIYLLKEDIAKLDGKLTTAIEASKSEMIKWTFTFVMSAVVINILAMLGAVFMVANILKH